MITLQLRIYADPQRCADLDRRCQYYDMSDISMSTQHDARCLLFGERLEEVRIDGAIVGVRGVACKAAEAGND